MNRALREFMRDLFAGDPVALGLVGGVLLFVVIIGLWGVKILRDKKRLDDERKQRLKKERQKKL